MSDAIESEANMKIEAGQKLTAKSACDYECVFTLEVIARKGSFVIVQEGNKTRRCKVREYEGREYLRPDNYSMAPIFRAPDFAPRVI